MLIRQRPTSSDDIAQRIADNVLSLRTLRGMSQPELAKLAVISRESIINIEVRHRTPNIKTLVNLANALGVDITELLKRRTING